MVARKAKSKQEGRPPKLPSTKILIRKPNHKTFDWSGRRNAVKHGFTLLQIEDAFKDPTYKTAPKLSANRAGTTYADDGRKGIFAQVKPNGPYMHILYTIVGGRIKPFHARRMTPQEVAFYKR